MLQGFYSSATSVAEHIEGAFWIHIWISVALFCTVVLPMLYFAWKYRESNVRDEDIENVTHNVPLEIVWTVIPTITILIMFWYGYTSMVEARSIPDTGITVKVEGSKWKWKYEYPANKDGFVHKITSQYDTKTGGVGKGALYVPVGTNIILEMSTPLNDVIHAYYVPAFRIKEDLVPGRLTKQWFNSNQVGEYDVECAEYCGTAHSYMYSKIVVMEVEDYNKWFESADSTPGANDAGQAKTGEDVYMENGCIGCHSTDDDSVLVGPSMKGLSAKQSAEYMRDAIVNPDKDIAEGFTPGIMTPYTMEENDMKLLLEYLKTK